MMLISKKKVFLISALIVLGVSSFIFCVWLTQVHVDSAFYLLPTRFWELLVGSIVAIQFSYCNKPFFSSLYYKPLLETAGLALIFYSIFFFDNKTLFPGYAAIAPVLGTDFIIRNTTSDTFIGRILSSKVLIGVGLISYSAYLWHQPLFAFVRHFYSHDISPLIYLALSIFTLCLSYFSWKYVEQPFRNKAIWYRKSIFRIFTKRACFTRNHRNYRMENRRIHDSLFIQRLTIT